MVVEAGFGMADLCSKILIHSNRVARDGYGGGGLGSVVLIPLCTEIRGLWGRLSGNRDVCGRFRLFSVYGGRGVSASSHVGVGLDYLELLVCEFDTALCCLLDLELGAFLLSYGRVDSLGGGG